MSITRGASSQNSLKLPVAVASVVDEVAASSLKTSGEKEAELEAGETLDLIQEEIDTHYPCAGPNRRRFVVRIPSQNHSPSSSSEIKVELWYGKWTIGDGANKYWLMGSDDETFGSRLVEKRSERGCKKYWEVLGSCDVWDSQLLAFPVKRIPTFARGPSTFLDYNAGESIVVYVPYDVDVKWRIWRPEDATFNALSV